MKRNVSLEEISDGKLYSSNDLVKADCGGCQGCSECCHGMGNSIILDPYDLHRLVTGLGMTAEQMLGAGYAELNVVDGIILPNLKMSGETEACTFLNQEGRCSIHPIRPGICRLFPLGRFYHEDINTVGSARESSVTGGTSEISAAGRSGGNGNDRSFRYFLQVHECPKPAKTKVRVRKWIDTPDLKQYESYIAEWHYFLEDIQKLLTELEDENQIKNINIYILKLFYLKPYTGDFYKEFYARLSLARSAAGL